MTLKQFIEEKNVTGFEIVSNLILNVVVVEERYQLDTDTSQLQAGTQLSLVETFTIDGDLLTVDGITVNTTEVNVNYESQ
jgi:hypothetical protein